MRLAFAFHPRWEQVGRHLWVHQFPPGPKPWNEGYGTLVVPRSVVVFEPKRRRLVRDSPLAVRLDWAHGRRLIDAETDGIRLGVSPYGFIVAFPDPPDDDQTKKLERTTPDER